MNTTDHRKCNTDNRATREGQIYCNDHTCYFDGTTGLSTNQPTDTTNQLPDYYRITVLDAHGKIQEWLDAGDLVAVWDSVEIGTRRPRLFTRHAVGSIDAPIKPHWAYQLFAMFDQDDVDRGDVVFFQRSQVVKTWTDTAQGRKAAHNYDLVANGRCVVDELGRYRRPDVLRPDNDYVKDIELEYTVQRLCYTTADDQVPRGRDGDTRPLDVNYRTAIIEWIARVDK